MFGSGERPADEDGVRQVHAAPSDPDVLNDPGPLTLCGLDTSRMLAEPWAPDRPGSRWYPPGPDGFARSAMPESGPVDRADQRLCE